MRSNKLIWVDSLKFIGIIAVILGHIDSPLGAFIFSWHMPLFFILSGFFIRTDLGINDFFHKEFKRLMIPYFIFLLLALFLETIKRLMLGRGLLIWSDEFTGALFWMDMDGLINSYAFVLWFLPALLMAKFVYYLIVKYIDSKLLQSILILTLFGFSFEYQLPFALDNGLNGLLFLYLGNNLFHADKKLWPLFLGMLLIIYFLVGFPMLDMSQKQYSNVLLNILWAVSFISLLILLFNSVKKVPSIVVFWGQNTMLLFIFHPYTNNVASVFFDRIGYGEWYLKLVLSLVLLQVILSIKMRFSHWRLFAYV